MDQTDLQYSSIFYLSGLDGYGNDFGIYNSFFQGLYDAIFTTSPSGNSPIFVQITDASNSANTNIYAAYPNDISADYGSGLVFYALGFQGGFGVLKPSAVEISFLLPGGDQGYQGPGFNAISNPGADRVLVSDGSTTAAVAQSNLTFDGTTLTIGTYPDSVTINKNMSNVDYIVFNNTNPTYSATASLIFYDKDEEALGYFSDGLSTPAHIGRDLFLRAYNVSGTTISTGQAVHVNGATDSLPTIVLSLSNPDLNATVNGVASADIPNGSIGLVTTNGVVPVDTTSLILTPVSPGDALYLSDTVPGKYSTYYFGLSYSSRANVVGYVIATGSNGTMYVSVNNENLNLSITDRQRNILEGNVISGGVFYFASPGITVSSSSTVNIGAAKGWIVDNAGATTSTRPTVQLVEYAGANGVTISNITTATETYFLLNSTGNLIQQTSFPTPRQRRQYIYLGKVGHPNKSSLSLSFPEPDLDISPAAQVRDMFTPIKLINNGVYPSAVGATLSFKTSTGTLWGLGIGYTTDVLNPSSIDVTAQSPVIFQYRLQNGGTYSNTKSIDPAYYDNAGVRTAIGKPVKQATNQRIYLLQDGQFRVQYGQTVYSDLATALSNVQSESFTTFVNFRDNAILIGILSVVSNATDLSNAAQAQFLLVSKFGESVGAAGGLSTTTLQQAYNNSTEPEIITNATNDGVTFRRGSAADTDNVFVIQNGSASNVTTIDGTGKTTTNTLTISAISLTSSLTKYIVVDNSGNTYYQILNQGATGPQGIVGFQGVQGYQGYQGLTGPQGFTGLQGTQGIQGLTGPQGPIGTGTQGVQGFQGLTGPQGLQGTGPQGLIGPVGATVGTIGITLNGNGANITTGSRGYINVPYSCTVVGWTLLSSTVSSILIDVKKSDYNTFPNTTSIVGSATPSLVSVQKNTAISTGLTGWSTTITTGDVLEYVVISNTNTIYCNLNLTIYK